MKYSIQEASGYSLATIEQPKSKTVVAYISTDLHLESTTKRRAAELLYTDSLLSGAGRYNREQFLDAVNSLGATISASISDSVLTIFVRSKADVFAKVLKLVETMLKEPHFSATEQKRIKQTVINAIKESKENSKAISHEQLRNAFYGLHDRRYTHDDEALIKAVGTITAKDLQKLHKHIQGLTWTCSVAGDKAPISTFKKTISSTNKYTKGKTGEFGIHQQKPPAPELLLKDIPSRQNIDFNIGAPIPITLHHPDFLPLMFGITVLGKWSGFAGRLMSTVREQEGLTYGIYAKTESFMNEEQGYWRVMTFFSPKDAA
jgi:predicted Zn-dependent peptidase